MQIFVYLDFERITKETSMHVKEYNIEIQVQVKVLLIRIPSWKKFCLNWKIERTIMKKMLDKFIYGFSMQYIEATVPDCRWKLNVILLCKDNIVANFLQIVFAKPAKEKRKHPAFLQFKFATLIFSNAPRQSDLSEATRWEIK